MRAETTPMTAAAHWSGKAGGVYFVLNPVKEALLGRRCNRWESYAEPTTGGFG